MIIHKENFSGEIPRTLPHLLPPNAAQSATDCDFTTNILQGLKANTTQTTLAKTLKSLFFYDPTSVGTSNTYGWTGREASAVKGPIANDSHNRFYWSDDTNGGLFVSAGSVTPASSGTDLISNRYSVGVPSPTGALTLAHKASTLNPTLNGFPEDFGLSANEFSISFADPKTGIPYGYTAEKGNNLGSLGTKSKRTSISTSLTLSTATALKATYTATCTVETRVNADPSKTVGDSTVTAITAMNGTLVGVGTMGQIFTSDDNGATWAVYKKNLGATEVLVSVFWDGSRLFVGSDSGNVFVGTSLDNLAKITIDYISTKFTLEYGYTAHSGFVYTDGYTYLAYGKHLMKYDQVGNKLVPFNATYNTGTDKWVATTNPFAASGVGQIFFDGSNVYCKRSVINASYYADYLVDQINMSTSALTNKLTIVGSSSNKNALRGIAFSGTNMLIVGDGGVYYHSTNSGTTWSAKAFVGSATLTTVAAAGSYFVAVGSNGVVHRLPIAGGAWLTISPNTVNELRVVHYSSSTLVVAGHGGTVFTMSSTQLAATTPAWDTPAFPSDAVYVFDGDDSVIKKTNYITYAKVRKAIPVGVLTFPGYGLIKLNQDESKTTFPEGLGGYSGKISVDSVNTTVYTDTNNVGCYTVTSTFTVRLTFETISATGGTAGTPEVEVVGVAYALVNNYGEVGQLSEIKTLEHPVNADFSIGIATASYAGYVPIEYARLYRSATGSQGTTLQFWKDIAYTGAAPIATDSSALPVSYGETPPAIAAYPPEAGLKGLCNMGGGMLAAFKGNEVHICEPYLPSSWSKIFTTESAVVSIIPVEGGLFITTMTHPYYITGTSTENLSQQKVTAVQAGVSLKGICNLGPVVAYATNDGIVTARGLDVTPDWGFKLFTRDTWRTLYGAHLPYIRMNAHDGHLLVWFSDGYPGFLVRYDEVSDPYLTKLADAITGAFVHPSADTLYVAVSSDSYYQLYRNGTGSKAFTWWSKDEILPKPDNFGCLQIVGSGNVTYYVYADGVQKASASVTLTDSTTVRLPSGFRARKWSVKIVGTTGSYVTDFTLATSPSELQNV